MAIRKTAFAVNEWYHCYSRGIDKQVTYKDEHDYKRFLEQLYLGNSTEPFHRNDIGPSSLEEVLQIPRATPLVGIGALSLMPNHFHLILKEIVEGGISAFMRKVGTAYAMYFNTRYERIGNIFVKPFRARHIDTDRYFQHSINYVHCNVAELYEPRWKTGRVKDLTALQEQIIAYPYSSLGAYEDTHDHLRALLDENVFDVVRRVPVREMLQEAKEYYQENPELP
ncbi:MAG: transposase [Candidatus Woesebacteria bacterium]|nr:transposase [Candidatus Woesebacteria bacterium]